MALALVGSWNNDEIITTSTDVAIAALVYESRPND